MDRLTYLLNTVIRKYNVICKYIWLSNNQLSINHCMCLSREYLLDDMTWIDKPTLKIVSQKTFLHHQRLIFRLFFWGRNLAQ